MNESIDLESNESANYSDDDSDDYQLNTNKKDYESINKISDDSDNEKPMETQLHGSYSVSANSRQRIKYQLDKIKRTKKMIHKKMESLDNNEKVKHISKIEKDKMILSAIQNATREEAVSTILSKLQKIEQFSDSVDYISSSAEELEDFIYNRCGKIVNKKYSEMARDVYANLNTLRISKIVCQLIINDQIGLKKLLCKPDKFLEKCKHLEQKFSRLIKPNSKIEVHNTCTDTLKVELKDDMNIQFDKIREENMKQLSNWMEKEKIDRQSCKSKLKQHMSENIQCKENEKQVKCMLSNDDYLTNKEESTKSDVDCEEGTYESKSSTETKPQELKLIKRVSPLKHKIKEIKENTMKQKSEKKLEGNFIPI